MDWPGRGKMGDQQWSHTCQWPLAGVHQRASHPSTGDGCICLHPSARAQANEGRWDCQVTARQGARSVQAAAAACQAAVAAPSLVGMAAGPPHQVVEGVLGVVAEEAGHHGRGVDDVGDAGLRGTQTRRAAVGVGAARGRALWASVKAVRGSSLQRRQVDALQPHLASCLCTEVRHGGERSPHRQPLCSRLWRAPASLAPAAVLHSWAPHLPQRLQVARGADASNV